jgi:hypothetical protein
MLVIYTILCLEIVSSPTAGLADGPSNFCPVMACRLIETRMNIRKRGVRRMSAEAAAKGATVHTLSGGHPD